MGFDLHSSLSQRPGKDLSLRIRELKVPEGLADDGSIIGHLELRDEPVLELYDVIDLSGQPVVVQVLLVVHEDSCEHVGIERFEGSSHRIFFQSFQGQFFWHSAERESRASRSSLAIFSS